MSHLFCFGAGFSAQALARTLLASGWTVTGTCRTPEAAHPLAAAGIAPVPLDTANPDGTAVAGALATATHILVSVPPDGEGCPVARLFGEAIAERAGELRWLGYLSTTGVYGNRDGGWVDERSALTPDTARGHRRLAAENDWLALHGTRGVPVHIFRLAGIYGPGRNALEQVASGRARRIVKPGQVFSRIHVDDIAGVLAASIARPAPGTAYNVCDDEACPPQDVIAHAARLLGVEPPPEIPFEEAGLSAMAASFYADNKRVANARIKRELGYSLSYPTYREGLGALLSSVAA
ncbi:SDR family oxidoreductase [Kaustia mangrovi]|uniref:SDR family oxidoreductase n=1 Tax=Kaustia mangrovi TaxID=2593653 RepID=A0A7S8HBK5_9HYPH|nr:SDR family oxidoreductase [Kaustia mangrovi]QPC42586.1 SDR family oxidoreductase [Kaustia mangrovi]